MGTRISPRNRPALDSQCGKTRLALTAAAVCGAPLALGSVHTPVIVALFALTAAALLLGLASRQPANVGFDFVTVALLALVAATAFQAIPLPAGLVELLSPRSAELHRSAAQSVAALSPRWHSLSIDAPSTWREAAKWAIVCMVYREVRELAVLSSRTRLLQIVALSGAAVAVVAIAHELLGAHAVYGLYQPDGLARVRGPFVNLNHQAGFLVLTTALGAGLALYAPNLRARLFWGGGVLLGVVAAVLSHSRAGIPAVVFGVVLTGVLALLERRRAPGWIAPVSVGGLVLVGLGSHQALTDIFSDRSASKLEIWRACGAFIRDYLWVGAGRGTFHLGYPRYQQLPDDRSYTHAENFILQLLAEYGVLLGAAAVIALLIGAAYLLLRQRDWALRGACAAGLVLLLLHNLFDFSLEVLGVAVPAAAVLAVCLSRSKSAPLPRARRPLFLSITALAGLGLFIGTRESFTRAEMDVRQSVAAVSDEVFQKRLGAAVQAHPSDYLLPLLAAARAHGRGDAGQTIRWLNRSLAIFPGSYDAHLMAARALRRSGRAAQAIIEYRLAAKARPLETVSIVQEVIASYKGFPLLGGLGDASPAGVRIWEMLAHLLEGPRSQEADLVDQAILKADPSNRPALLRRARWTLDHGQYDQVARLAVDLQRIDPAQAARFRGLAALAQGRRDLAMRELTQATQKNGDSAPLWIDLARVALRAGDGNRARAALERARYVANAGETAGIHLASALLLEGAGEQAAALVAFERAVDADPSEQSAWEGVLRLAGANGRPDLESRARAKLGR